MRKDNANMVSLNPEYGIEVTALAQLADSVKDDNPELYAILTVLIASLLGKDEKTLLDHCNRYLEEQVYSDNIKQQINKMLKEYKGYQLPDDNDNPQTGLWEF